MRFTRGYGTTLKARRSKTGSLGLNHKSYCERRSGAVVLLELTPKGRASLVDALDVPELPSRRVGLVHEYWKHKIAANLRAKGMDVQVEAPLETGGTVDILVQTEEGPRAIEIETGKSDVKANVEKCQSTKIAVTAVATDQEAQKKLEGLLGARTRVICTLDPDFHENLSH